MSVQYKMYGTIQYQLTAGAAADAWLSTWILTHQGDLREHEGNGHMFQPLIPAHAEGCLSQLVIEYHFETSSYQQFADLFDEVTAAIYGGTATPFAAGDCDSSWGSAYEAG